MTPDILVSESRVKLRPVERIWERTQKRQLDENLCNYFTILECFKFGFLRFHNINVNKFSQL